MMANHLFGNPQIRALLILSMIVVGALLEQVPA